ncbi:TPA: winged helix-turn-helix domain-containing protein [Enterobacter cloacae]|uniref:Helix-turn-helix domain-containing protein n=1 Tax=Citrobacter portucalensis TaxID=1639133 RepID=A0AAW5VUP1_9ENTR|nr:MULTISPECIES: helix-turn-helix domain-containing protein [Enterobacteriaceae]UAS93139.1 helix-turn-helix domain-containing protein [Enterobacter cloacae complex sp.]HDC4598978.1 winged helix-turn-helix domain-containing protein [Enterobacter cloacae]ELE9223985.1 winged helix-turn-helix domain-containing protein [Enterobacter kobei]MBE9676433.1 helix-turn-helix domain-containing protein [Escherichia coli]MBE9751144.1 helix-turn-helix domain-containing protein [Escherichia coli]
MNGLTIPFEHFQTNKIAGVNFTPVMKLVYFFLDANKDLDGVIHISQTDLANMVGVTRPTIGKVIKSLKEMGLLAKSEQVAGNDILNYKTLPIRQYGHGYSK